MAADPYISYDRVFVIIRVDTSPGRAGAPETAIALTKALWSEAAAETEVARLNQLNREPGNVYFWKATRVERQPTPAGAV